MNRGERYDLGCVGDVCPGVDALAVKERHELLNCGCRGLRPAIVFGEGQAKDVSSLARDCRRSPILGLFDVAVAAIHRRQEGHDLQEVGLAEAA